MSATSEPEGKLLPRMNPPKNKAYRSRSPPRPKQPSYPPPAFSSQDLSACRPKWRPPSPTPNLKDQQLQTLDRITSLANGVQKFADDIREAMVLIRHGAKEVVELAEDLKAQVRGEPATRTMGTTRPSEFEASARRFISESPSSSSAAAAPTAPDWGALPKAPHRQRGGGDEVSARGATS